MYIGRSALVSSQIGIQVTGNNLANAATPGYSRQVMHLQPTRGQLAGSYTLGRGVGIRAVERQIDTALQDRLRESIGSESAAFERSGVLSQLESIMGELSGFDLSSELSSFFNTWSDAANLIQSDAVVVEQGQKLAAFMRAMRSDLADLREQVESQIDQRAQRADTLLTQVADINRQIAGIEGSGATANELRDRRDEILAELAAFMDVSAVEDAQGVMDVFVGSTPVVLAGESRGVSVQRTSNGEIETVRLVVSADGTPLPVTKGSIGGLLQSRDAGIDEVIDRMDTLAAQLIFEVNKAHATGTDLSGMTSASGQLRIASDDRARPLNDPNNQTFQSLPFGPKNGGFLVNITNPGTGITKQVRIDVDLDGVADDFSQGFQDDTSAADIVAALDGIDGLNARFTPDGRLDVTADPGFRFSFAEDSSGVLGTLGVNAFFTGTSAGTIGVRTDLETVPTRLTTGRITDGQFVENGTALEITGMQDRAMTSLGGETVRSFWQNAVQVIANDGSTARTDAESASLVRQSLEAQRASVSGVSVDEESINLLNYQRQFEGAARLIQTADELLNTLIAII